MQKKYKGTKAMEKETIEKVLKGLSLQHPDAKPELDFENPYQLLIATILSAQCTDKQVNKVTPALFRDFKTPAELA